MPRRNRTLRPEPRQAAGGGATRVESFGGESYEVRAVAGGGPNPYRCPGCDQLIAPALRHVVAWRADGDGEDRRHWHTACWNSRERRTVTRRWS